MTRHPAQTRTVPPLTQAERLTGQFYAWEKRGRGWKVHEHPVDLEPPFSPFRYHWVPISSGQRDDAHKPTFLSHLTDQLLGKQSQDPAGDLMLDVNDEPEAEEWAAGEMCELQVVLPPDADVSPEATESFLLGLPRMDQPLAFEVIGTESEITVQIACGAGSRRQVTEYLKAYFPEAIVTEAPGKLEQAWTGQQGESFVVEFGLSEEFMLPLRTMKRFAVDPLTAVAAALSDLGPGEAGCLQILFQPVRAPWSDSIMRAVLDDEGSPFFLDAPQVAALAKEKISRPLYACVIRVGGHAAGEERALMIVRSLGWSLQTLANPPGNRLIPLDNDDYPDETHSADLLLRRTHRSGMILSSAELVSLVHPPSSSVQVEKLLREARKTAAAPAGLTGHPYILGQNQHAGKSAEVSLSEEQRSRHLYVIGASGTGKSTLLLNLILQDMEHGRGLAVLDPHGDLVDEILRRCPEHRASDVVLMDPADTEYSIGFNILSAHSEMERTLLSSDLVAVFRRLSTSWGDQMTSVLGNAILAFLENDRGGTLLDLRRFLVEPGFRREILTSVKDPEIVYYWEKEFTLLKGNPQAPILTRLDTFLRPKPIRYMVAQKESRLNLRSLMDDGKILLARLSQGAIGEENAYLLGTLLVSKFHQLAMSRQEMAAADRRPFYLYIDEFQNFVTPSLEAVLSGARKYRLGLVLAHQDLRQISSRSPEVLSSVLANAGTRITFRVGDHDAKTLAEGLSHFDARDLQSLGIGEALARIEGAGRDFNLRTSLLPTIPAEEGEARMAAIAASSRAAYARSRTEIEVPVRPDPKVTAAEPAQAPRLPASVKPPATPAPSAPVPVKQPAELEALAPVVVPCPGRGGAQHKYLQELVRRWAEANGWRCVLEEPVLDALGRVDVALRKNELSIACEIGVSSNPDHELQNILKCLAAGFGRVLAVSPENVLLNRLKRLAGESLSEEQTARVSCCTPEELFTQLDALEAEASSSGKTVRGYRVKVRMKTAAQDELGGKRGAVASVVARALRRIARM